MDKKKKMMKTIVLTSLLMVFMPCGKVQAQETNAQKVDTIVFCDKKFNYQSDSITLCFNILNIGGQRRKDFRKDEYYDLKFYADGNEIGGGMITSVNSGQRIPEGVTFSILIDQNIPEAGKREIRDVVRQLVESSPDSSVYLSFFGDKVTSSKLVTKSHFSDFDTQFFTNASKKFFYSAVYAKMAEFSQTPAEGEKLLKAEILEDGYTRNASLTHRAESNRGKNNLFIITDGVKKAEFDLEGHDYGTVTDLHRDTSHDYNMPRVFAFYYTGGKAVGEDDNIVMTLRGVTGQSEGAKNIDPARKGSYRECTDMTSVIDKMKETIADLSYDYQFTYKVDENESFAGKTIHYVANWRGEEKGGVDYTIGTKERPWPERPETTTDTINKYLVALLITLLTVAFFFLVMKVLVPFVKSKMFSFKYYKRYQPEAGISRRICSYCKNDFKPGDLVVTKCKDDPRCGHLIHVRCWQQNRYRCAEYGQRCNNGIQQYVEWSEVFSWRSFRDCRLTIYGIIAGLVSWIIYELMGRGGFSSLATPIVKTFFTNEKQLSNHFDTCVTKVSAFLAIGLLLGFFLSLIFRFYDEYRDKNWMVYMKNLGLVLLSTLVGMVAFALGGAIFCMILSAIGTPYVPWWCSLPAYLLFSVCLPLSLTIKSTISLKTALLGGLASAVIGFFVLYFADTASSKSNWMNMLLNFIIYGGGLGASLQAVRMLADRYWLVIKNGVKAGTRIPIHKWMNATGGGNKVTLGMTYDCEIMMNWEKSNKVAKEHAQLYINHERKVPVLKPLATGVEYNMRVELPVGKEAVLSNGDLFKIGDTIFQYTETE